MCFNVDPADVDGLVMVVRLVHGGGTLALATIKPFVPPADGFGPDELAAGLQDVGVDARVVPSPYAPLSILRGVGTEHVLCLNGQESTLYEYGDEDLREADSATIRPDGSFESGYVDLYFGQLMWWATGRVIVFYAFADPDIWDALTAVMGETISPDGTEFSTPPDPLPLSEICA